MDALTLFLVIFFALLLEDVCYLFFQSVIGKGEEEEDGDA